MTEIPVPNNIAAVALGGDIELLHAVDAAYINLMQTKVLAQEVLDAQPEVVQVLADGLARQKVTGDCGTVDMRITDKGRLVVCIRGRTGETPVDEATPGERLSNIGKLPTPSGKDDFSDLKALAQAEAAVGPAKVTYPSIGDLRKRAAACGADITGIAPQNKKAIVECIYAAEGEEAEQRRSGVPVSDIETPDPAEDGVSAEVADATPTAAEFRAANPPESKVDGDDTPAGDGELDLDWLDD